MGNFMPNDVIEGAAGEVFVSLWKLGPQPRLGSSDKMSTWRQKVDDSYLAAASLLLDIPTVMGMQVLRCTNRGGASGDACAVAASGFNFANGITISTDRQFVFVNDLLRRMVVIFRLEAGVLKKLVTTFPVIQVSYSFTTSQRTLHLDHVVDNIEFDSGR
jgi:hypothetical protein